MIKDKGFESLLNAHNNLMDEHFKLTDKTENYEELLKIICRFSKCEDSKRWAKEALEYK